MGGSLEWLDIDWAEYTNLKTWYDLISDRPTVQRGLTVMEMD